VIPGKSKEKMDCRPTDGKSEGNDPRPCRTYVGAVACTKMCTASTDARVKTMGGMRSKDDMTEVAGQKEDSFSKSVDLHHR